jgi:exonuclease V gamma subunit
MALHERFFFSSHSLGILAEALSRQLLDGLASLFQRVLIVIPHGSVKEWLQMELCRNGKNKSILGLEFVSWESALSSLAGSLPIPTRAELLAAIWQQVNQKFDSERKKLDFVEHLATLFREYTCSGLPRELPEEALWQKILFEEIFQKYSWQTMPEVLSKATSRDLGPIYLFGIDHLPAAAHRFFLQYQKLNVFRFSPTSMFWEDLHPSDGTQPLLANWGSLGKKMLADAAALPSQEGECYDLELADEPTTLQRLKLDFLLLEKQEFIPGDSSIRCLKTGSSKLQEVQILRQEIEALATKGVPLSEMRVYAPDIAFYAPLIEFCFGEAIPYRIARIDVSRQSSFYQAIVSLFRCVEGRWEADEILALFERSALYRKANWQGEEVKRFQEWIRQAKIRWGLDAAHRRETAEIEGAYPETGSWKDGFAALVDSWIFLQPEKEEAMSWLEADLFQKFYQSFNSLCQTLLSWKKDRTLAEWAEEIEKLVRATLFFDESSEADRAAERSFSLFLDLLRKLAKKFPEDRFPFSFVETYFFTFSTAEVGGSLLHAVRFASLEPGAILPARALFLLGMDEESFPRSSPISSLRLLAQQGSASELDRYLFLQLVFAAKEQLIFSYSHRSKEDGKNVSPTLLIEELFSYIGACFETPILHEPARKSFSFIANTDKIPELPSAPEVLSIQELARFFKNPFQHYLKTLGISLKEEPDSAWESFEFSGLKRHLILRESLTGDPRICRIELPLGLFGNAAKVNLEQGIEEFKETLSNWAIEPSSIQTLTFKEITAPLEVPIEGKRVLLVGEAALAVPTGVLHMGRDEIGSYFRRWPEILCALVANKGRSIYCLKTGRIREVSDPSSALQAAIELYLRCQKIPFFLHPEWADDLLRKDRVPDECEDRIMRWALKRSPGFSLEAEKEIWKETLRKIFAPLTALFERGASAAL